jgi:TonB family protein
MPQTLVLALLTAVAAAGAQAAPPGELRSLHLRQTVEGGDDFVFVEPVGPDVRVRAVRVAHLNQHCPSRVVQAAERMLRGTTVQAVVAVPVCSMTQSRIDRAQARVPRWEPIDAFGGIEAIAAECDTEEREFVSRTPPFPDRDALQRDAPEVAAMWTMLPRLRALALDSAAAAPFASADAGVMSRRTSLGTAVVPALLSGKYGQYLSSMLADYAGPPAGSHPSFVELIDADTLALTSYTAPVMPQIALSARVFGDVVLRVTVEPRDGAVTGVTVVSGAPLLRDAAVTAAKSWRFTPGTGPPRDVEATLRFQVRCV